MALLGWQTADRLFGSQDPLEKVIRVAGVPFRVVGVSKKKVAAFGQSLDEFVVIPLGAYQKLFGARQSLALMVKPRDAQVFVDGYYVGVVDEFDGTFQRLRLDTGPHRIEIRKEGFETLRFDVRVTFDHTITLRGELKPAAPTP